MAKTLFALSYRAGSSLFLSMLGENTKKARSGQIKTYSFPRITCAYHSTPEEIPANGFGWYRFAQTISSPWEPTRMKQAARDWRIIPVVRDGRNQIASWYRHIQKHNPKQITEKLFEEMCDGFKKRANYFISLQKQFSVHIVKFEDLIQDPAAVLSDIFNFLEVKSDVQKLTSRAVSLLAVKPKHSSWNTFENMNKRWESWTDQEKRIFNRIAGKALRRLGYR